MSLLARIFGKKKVQPKLAEKKPVINLDSMAPDALLQFVATSHDEEARNAALQKITDVTALLSLAGFDGAATTSASLQKATKHRIAQLVDAGAIQESTLRAAIPDQGVLLSLLAMATNQQLFDRVFATIDDQSTLADLVTAAATSKVRQRAAEKITDKMLLLKLQKELKTKDKTVFKIIREKCDIFKEEEKRAADNLAAVTQLVQSLEQQGNRPYDGQFSAKVGYLEQQWRAKQEQATPELRARAEAAIATCKSTIANVSAEQAAEDAERSVQIQADSERAAHIQQLQDLLLSIVSQPVNPDETQALIRLLDAAWKNLNELKKPSATEQKQVEALHRLIAAEVELQQTHGSLAQHKQHFEHLVTDASETVQHQYQVLKQRVTRLVAAFKENVPPVIAEAKASYEHWEQAAAEKTAEIQALQRQVGGLIRKTTETVQSGVLGKAMGMRKAIDEKLAHLQQVPTHIANQLAQLDEALAKLQDWKNYAVQPKKQALIAQLQALDGKQEHPEALATKIKRLQDEWRALTKGTKDQDQELWEQFHALAQKIYEPCRDYFAQQAAIRAQNLESCKQLVAQLQDYLANYTWDSANWKEVEKVIRVARQEWRSYSPTERAATQPVLAEFDAALDAIQKKLHEEFSRNAVLKKELIAQAEQLLAQEDVRKAAEEMKQLQTRWQTIGSCLRKEEQQLWQAFRDNCDAVFAKRQQQSVEFKAELEANLTAAQVLVTELGQLATLQGEALTDARKRVDDIRQAFGGLGQFPKAQVNEIKQAFTRALEAFDQQVKAERAVLKQQVWVNLFNANRWVNDYELALVAGKAVDVSELQAQLDTIAQWPAGGLKAVQQKLARASAGTNLRDNAAALRQLCIRAEILSDTPSPAEDQAERRAFQVNQLQQNFGRKGPDVSVELEQMVFEWVAVGAVDTMIYESLFKRFNQARLNGVS